MSNNSEWRGKYKNLKDYYKNTYPEPYYLLDNYEMSVDPDETAEQINAYDENRQQIEKAKCIQSFPYFCTKYAKILHPKRGLIPLILFQYQKEVISCYDSHKFNIIKKFRQGGLTTISEIWAMWRCLFRLDQQILFISKTDLEAITAGEIVNTAHVHLPTWMQAAKDGKWNDHQKYFAGTGGKMNFGTPERARGLAKTYLILDEAAFIPDMFDHWKGIFPTLSTGGNCIVISTVNGVGNWYHSTYKAAESKKNDFNIIDLHYSRHPDYHNEAWVKSQKKQLREKGWLQEVLGEFLGSGETYIPPDVVGNLFERTRVIPQKRKQFNSWVNKNDQNEEDWENDGALWVWKEPVDSHEYIFGVDCAEGISDEGDNSCIEIFDLHTMEQVAEFYSNTIPTHIFSQLINELAIYYNHALVVIENMGPGGSVLSNLQFQQYYDNIYFESAGKGGKERAGIKTTQANRPMILEALRHRLMTNSIKINSKRFVRELTTFIYNAGSKKAKAEGEGSHDDAIMAAAICLYINEQFGRNLPVGAEIPTDTFKANIYEEIKKEIFADSPEDYLSMKDQESKEDELLPTAALAYRRRYAKILAEFGW